MRIGLLSWESLHSIAIGGVASHVTELAASLARAGHEVHVFTRMAPGQRFHDFIDGVHYQRCPYPGHPDFVDDVNNLCRAFVERVFVVEDTCGAFDVIHAHDWLAANAMIWIKQGRGRRGVLTIHSTEYARSGNAFYGGRSQRIRDQERAGTYWADRVIAVSQATKGEIQWMYQVPEWKTSVVYNGVSAHRFNLNVDPGEVKKRYGVGPFDPLVLFCGRLEWQKGPDLLIEAVPAVLAAHPGAKFMFVGDGGMRGPLENRAKQLGVAHATRFLGFRTGDELIRLFKSCETVCVPSRNEPFGIVVLEAWSASKPVVVTQNGGPNEYVWHEVNGLKIFPHTNSVVWGLCTMFANFDRARRMGANGRRAVEERFTWDQIAGETLAAYGIDQTKAEVSKPKVTAEAVLPAPRRFVTPSVPVLVQARLTFRGNGHLGPVLTACRRVLVRAGIPFQIGQRSAILSGEWETVSAAVRQCYQLVERMGGARIKTVVRPASQAEESYDAERQEVAAGLPGSPRPKGVALPAPALTPAIVAAQDRRNLALQSTAP
jgi:glycosyltransferase involved in cell wall biosynthesis/uncharacterized protein YqgV (UPF0045/DUF77 family)